MTLGNVPFSLRTIIPGGTNLRLTPPAFASYIYDLHDDGDTGLNLFTQTLPVTGQLFDTIDRALIGSYGFSFAGAVPIAYGSSGDLYAGRDNTGEVIGQWQVETAPAGVPIPATGFLFGSGLLALVGVARRKKGSLVSRT